MSELNDNSNNLFYNLFYNNNLEVDNNNLEVDNNNLEVNNNNLFYNLFYNNFLEVDNNNRENLINLQIRTLDVSNLQNRISDISRNMILEQLFNLDHIILSENLDNSNNSNYLNYSNLFLNLLENNLNNILHNQETLYTNYNSSFMENFINSTFEVDNKKKFKRVVTDDELKKLKIQKFDENMNYANKECPINLTTFKQDDEIIILPCNHAFSSESIKIWLNNESNCCPICRYELEYKEIKCEEITNNNEENEDNLTQVEPETFNYTLINNDTFINEDDDDIILQQILLNSYSARDY